MGAGAAASASLSDRKTITVLLPLIVALVPLVIAPGLVFYFDVTPKVAILLIGVALTLPWFAPAKLWGRREGRWLYSLLAIQAASLILSTVLSSRVRMSIFGTSWRRFGLITQLAVLLFTALAAADLAGSRTRLRLYLRAIALGAIPISLYGVAQYFGWDPWIPKQAYHVGEGFWTIVRPPSTLGYVSYFANYLVFAVFFGAALFSIEESGWWKRAGAAVTMLASTAIVLSGTRAAILSLAAGGAYVWLSSGRPVRGRVMAWAAGAMAALTAFYFSPAGQMLRSRTRWYEEDVRGGGRLLLWHDSLALAAGHWLTGAGPETFSSEFPRVQSAALSRAYPDFYHESAHNILLDALTAQGIAGVLALLGIVALGFYAAWKVRKMEPALGAILGACLAAGLVTHQFAVFTTPTAVYFYLTVAMLVALGGAGAPSSRVSLFLTIPISGAFLLLAARLLIADHGLQQVKADLIAGNPTAATLEYSRVRDWGMTADLWYSRQMAAAALKATDTVGALKAWQQALEAGVRATQTSDDPYNAWYSLAALHGRQNDFESTERCLRAAIASSPNWFKPHWMLAQVLLAKGHRDEAGAEAALAVSLDGEKDVEVARTLAQIQRKQK
jgi:O-antigen ligase